MLWLSIPQRPISVIAPVVTNAELGDPRNGRSHVRFQVVKVVAKVSSCRSSNSCREKRKPPQNQLVESRAQALPFHDAFRRNQTESLST